MKKILLLIFILLCSTGIRANTVRFDADTIFTNNFNPVIGFSILSSETQNIFRIRISDSTVFDSGIFFTDTITSPVAAYNIRPDTPLKSGWNYIGITSSNSTSFSDSDKESILKIFVDTLPCAVISTDTFFTDTQIYFSTQISDSSGVSFILVKIESLSPVYYSDSTAVSNSNIFSRYFNIPSSILYADDTFVFTIISTDLAGNTSVRYDTIIINDFKIPNIISCTFIENNFLRYINNNYYIPNTGPLTLKIINNYDSQINYFISSLNVDSSYSNINDTITLYNQPLNYVQQ